MTDSHQIVRFSSSRFGDIEVPADRLITVPDGIIGFPDFTRYALLDPSGGQSLFLWLHSVDSPDLAFIITDPVPFVPDYRIDASEPDLDRLALAGKEPPALFVIVTVPENDPDMISANLLAPLLFFESDSTLHQIVLEKGNWPLRYHLLAEERCDAGAGSAGEVR
jgi:flagellar assembly factor FliW